MWLRQAGREFEAVATLSVTCAANFFIGEFEEMTSDENGDSWEALRQMAEASSKFRF